MGSAYANIKQPGKALELYQQALAIDRSMKNEIDEAVTLGYIADMQETPGATSICRGQYAPGASPL